MQNSPTIVVTGSSIDPLLLKPLEDAGCIIKSTGNSPTEQELIWLLHDADVYLLGGDEFVTARAIEHARNLELIAFYGIGYESFMDVDAVRARGIRVTNTPKVSSNSVAEFTVGQLLNCRRGLTRYAIGYSNGLSGNEKKQQDISGHTVGIVGMGAIGTRIAEMLTQGFGSEVGYFSRTRKEQVEERLGICYRPLNDLFSTVESVIVMVPGNHETRGLVGAEQLSRLAEGSILINTARPEIVEPSSLLEHLKSERIAAAAFDGFYGDESSVVRELRKLQPSPLTVTGHIASLTHCACNAMARDAVESILNFLARGTDERIVE